MLIPYKKLEKTAVVLNDLIKINNDRIACYKQVLNNGSLDKALTGFFERMINEGGERRAELINKVKELKYDLKKNVNLPGIIYRVWMDLKGSFMGNTRDAVIRFCMYNEEVTLHTYKAALNLSEKIDDDVKELITGQQNGLKNTYELIRSYKEARHYSDSMVSYF